MSRAFLQLVVPGGTAGVGQGGVRFGPYTGPVRIGADTNACQIVLDRAGGVQPDHAIVTLYPSGVFGVEPRPGAGVWLAPQGQAQLWPVTSPVQCNPGDHLIFGNPGGVRLQLQLDGSGRNATTASAGPSAAAAGGYAASGGYRQGGYGGGGSDLGSRVGQEIVRQGTVRMLARAGPLREIYYVYQRFSRGSLNGPYVIVSVLFAVMAALATGTLSCTGLLSTIWWKLMHH